MEAIELAKWLRETYEKAPARDKTLHVTLFGVREADELDRYVSKDICDIAEIGNWGPQLNLAKEPAKHVLMK